MGKTTITGENSLVGTTCSGNGNSSWFPGSWKPTSSELAAEGKD